MESIYDSEVDPLSTNNCHAIALQLIGTGNRVLELGSANGHVTKALKLRGNHVTAVERDARFSEHLQSIADNVIVTDLDWLDLTDRFLNQQFDVILAGDVLEHCRNPDLVILQFHRLLASGGSAILSIPNIAHGDVRLSLLAGKFDYKELGLLDETHIRFFTRDSMNSFLSRNGFIAAETFSTYVPVGSTEFAPLPEHLPSDAVEYVKADRDASVYQFVLRAVPQDNYIVDTPSMDTWVQRPEMEYLLRAASQYQELSSIRGREIDALVRKNNSLNAELKNLQITLDAQKGVERERQKIQMELDGLKSQLLTSNDRLIGLQATNDELKFRLARSKERYAKEMGQIRSSWTWRVGRFFLLPTRVVGKLFHRAR
jgi:SAM-dependent methyltransferase